MNATKPLRVPTLSQLREELQVTPLVYDAPLTPTQVGIALAVSTRVRLIAKEFSK